MSNSIFKGAQYYREEDKASFHGREKEAESLLYLVKHNDFSVCYAESGEGKSSLINAGLFPRLREEDMFPIRIQFTDDDFRKNPTQKYFNEKAPDIEINFDELVWTQIRQAIEDANKKDEYRTLMFLETLDLANGDDKYLKDKIWFKLRAKELRLNSYKVITPVLIFDQFEEVFTKAKDINWTDKFFCWLEDLYNDEYQNNAVQGNISKRFKILFSLRSDFVSELDYWAMRKYFIPALKNNRYCLKALTKDSAREIIRGLEYLPGGLTEEDILNAAKTEKAGSLAEVKDDLPCISALVLSLVLTELVNKDHAVVEKLNDLKDNKEYGNDKFFLFLMNYIYDRALRNCGIEKDSPLCANLEETLIDANGRRRRVSLRELQDLPYDKLEKLAKERIVNVIGDYVEISHDCLCKIIELHNKERIARLEDEKREAEQAKFKAIRQKHNVYMFICMFIAFSASYLYLYNFAYDTVVPYIARNDVKIFSFAKEILYSALIIFIPVISISSLYLRKWTHIYLRNVTTMFVFFLFLYSILIYKDLMFCPVPGFRSDYKDSACMTWIIPMLCFLINQKKPLWHYLLYAVILIPIMLNAFCLFQFSLEWLIGYLLLVIVFVFYSFARCEISLKEKFFWIFFNAIILFASVCIQIGFNPIKIDYNQVVRDSKCNSNWETVAVRANDKIGVLSSLSGDTIMSFVVEKMEGTSFYISKTEDLELRVNGGGYFDQKGDSVICYFVPSLEYSIYSYKKMNSTSLDDSLKYFASYVYAELRDEIIWSLQTGKELDIKKIMHLKDLDRINKKKTVKVLSEIENANNLLSDRKINELYRAVYTDLCLCSIKDRLLNNDLENVLNLFGFFRTCYFLEEENKAYNKFFSYDDGAVKFKFSVKDLINNNSYAYAGMLHIIAGVDIRVNAENILCKLRDDNAKLNDIRFSLFKDLRTISNDNFIKSVFHKMNNGQSVRDAIENTKQQLIGGWKKRLERLNSMDTLFVYNYIESEISYKLLSDVVLNSLFPKIGDEKYVNYSGSLIDICKELIKINVCRWYEDGASNVDKLEKMDQKRLNDSYILIKEIIKQVNNNKDLFNTQRELIKKIRYTIHQNEKEIGEI